MSGRTASIIAAVLVFLAWDSPYGAWLIHRLLGTFATEYVGAGGTPVAMVIGQDVPRPDWLPLPDDGLVVTASKSGPEFPRLETGTFDYVTALSRNAVASHYEAYLGAHGFEVIDDGLGPLNPATARYLAIAGGLHARDTKEGREVRISIREPQGWLFPHRFVQIVWARTTPGGGPAWPEPPAPASPPSPPFTGGSRPS